MVLPLRARLLASIGLPVLIISALIPSLTFVRLSAEERRETVRQLAVEAGVVAERFDALFERGVSVAKGNARAIEVAPDMPRARVEQLLRDTVADMPSVYGAAIAFEPGTFGPPGVLVAPYVHRSGADLVTMDIDASVYDWYGDERWTWWHGPKASGIGGWTEAYLDEGAGNVTMITYSEPFLGAAGTFRGVATVDIEIASLATRFAERLAGTRDFVILDADGRLLAARNEDISPGVRLADLASTPGFESLAELATRIERDGTGTARIITPDVQGPQLVGFAPIGRTGWTFVFRVPEHETMGLVRQHVLELTGGLLFTLILILAVVWFMAGRMARPVVRLRDGVAAVAGGDLDARVEGVERRDEIGQLAVAFNGMTGTLQQTLDRLGSERASRARIERDLDMAREIQRGLLPRESMDLEGFTVAGWNQPADKTGGDYYDWLPLPDGRALVTLADVTGHGIGPALIVAACRAYVRASAVDGGEPLADTLARVNRLLVQDVGEGRFVTAAVGLIDAAAGQLHLISAGQAPILFVHGESGEIESWPADTVPLGILDPLPPARVRVVDFARGDQLVMVTDGFFEWADASRELFGFDRMLASIRSHRHRSPAELIAQLYADVQTFAGGTPQTDDLTAVVIRRD